MQDLLGAPPRARRRRRSPLSARWPTRPCWTRTPTARVAAVIQGDKLAELLRDPAVAAYAKLLADAGLKIDQTFLGAYNQYTLDEAVRVVRVVPPHPQTPEAIARSAAVNDPAHAAALRECWPSCWAQFLWNVYRMDPAWMLAVMERYGPMDWRLPEAVAIYWLALGQKLCPDTTLADVDALNNQGTSSSR